MSLTTIRNHSNITSTVKSDKQIIIATATFTDLGMEIKAVSTPSMFDKHELEIIANYYSVIIAQSQEMKLYGPFPVPHKDNWILNTLKFQIIDNSVKDERVILNGGKVPAFLLIFSKESLTNDIFRIRDKIEFLASRILPHWKSTREIDDQHLLDLSNSIRTLLPSSTEISDADPNKITVIQRSQNSLTKRLFDERISIIKALVKYQLVKSNHLTILLFVNDDEVLHFKRSLASSLRDDLIEADVTLRTEDSNVIALLNLKEILFLITNNQRLTLKLNKINDLLNIRIKGFDRTLYHVWPNGLFFSSAFLLKVLDNKSQFNTYLRWINSNKQLNIIAFDSKKQQLSYSQQFSKLVKHATEKSIDILIPTTRSSDDVVGLTSQILERMTKKLLN